MSPIVSHWMPAESSNVLNPSAHSRKVVGVVKGLFHQTLDRETYLSLLAERLNYLLSQEEEPETALYDLISTLDEKLPEVSVPELPTNPAQDGSLLSESKMVIQALDLYLRQLNIPGQLPDKMPPNVLAAQSLYEQTDLESWLSNLLNQPTNPDR